MGILIETGMNHRTKAVRLLMHSLAGLVLLLSSCGSQYSTVTVAIPPLDTKGDVYKTEGENDPLIYGDAVGKKKMIFVSYLLTISKDFFSTLSNLLQI